MSTSELSFKLAWRFFRGGRGFNENASAEKRDGLVSLISGVSTIGMTIAVALLIVVLSVMNGFDREFRMRILGLSPHANIQLDAPLTDWQAIVEDLEREPGVTGVYPYNGFEAMLMQGREVTPVLVQGLDIASRWQQFQPFIDLGQGVGRTASFIDMYPDGLAERAIVIGASLAQKHGIAIGQSVKLLKVDGAANTGARGRTRPIVLTVAGIIRTGTQIDNHVGLMSLHAAGLLSGANASVVPGEIAIEGIHLQFEDVFLARDSAYALAVKHRLQGRLSDWTRDYGNLYMAIQLSRQLVVMLVATIVAIAVFNVFVTLGMVVRHKYREIAILRTLGLPRKAVLRTFVWQGLFIALPGCVFGVVLGAVLASVLPHSVNWVQQVAGIELLNTEVYPINYLPSQVLVSDVLLIVVVALGMSLLATLGPAWKASTMQPVKVLNRDL